MKIKSSGVPKCAQHFINFFKRIRAGAATAISFIFIKPWLTFLLIAMSTSGIFLFSKSHSEIESEENEGIPIVLQSFQQWTDMRSYPNNEIHAQNFSKAYGELRSNMKLKQANSKVDAIPWTPLGPTNFAGRALCLAVSPTNPNTMFIGTASGGLWKTTTGGTGGPGGISWTYVPTGFPVIGVGAVAINPLNANEIYVGTGEVYSKNQGGATGGGHIRTYRGFYGIGILKSMDGGVSWEKVLNFEQSNLEGINDFVINPLNPSTVFAATSDGLYRTNNSGGNWDKIHTVSMAMDLAMKPGDTSVLYVGSGNFGSAGNGLYKSTNAGAASPTFTKLTSGLPTSYSGMARIAIAPSNTSKIYASIGHDPNTTTKYGLYVSTNEGATWKLATSTNIIDGQGWYAHDVVVDPTNANNVFWSEIDIYKSTNAGSSFSKVSSWSGWNLSNTTVGTLAEGTTNYSHADNHRLYFYNGVLYTLTDGGLFRSTNGGTNFQSLNGGLQTVQIYSNISAGQTDPNYILGGLQDNGTLVYRGQPGMARVIGADGFCTAIDPSNDNISFAQIYNFSVKKSTDKGYNWATNAAPASGEASCFNSPIIFAKNNPNILYGGTVYLKKTTNKGSSWANANGGAVISGTNNPILTLAVAPSDDNVVYISTTPGGGNRSRLYKTINGGTSVTNITGSLPDRYYTKIAIDSADKNRIAVTLSGFGSSHVFMSYDGGINWTDIGDGLPDVPHNTVTFDPYDRSILYIGNDLGVYSASNVPTTATGTPVTWTSYNEGFTDATFVSDLLVTGNKKLRMATFGRGLWERNILGIPPPPPIPCDVPSGLSNSGITLTAATISWDTTNEAISYDVDYKLATATTWIAAATATTNTTVNLNGLSAASSYNWRVKNNCPRGTSSYATAQFSTLVPCGIPAGLTTNGILGTSANLNWTAVSGANSYVVEYKLSTASIYTEADAAFVGTSYPLVGLTNSKSYNWRVRNNCPAGISAYSAVATFTTPAPCGLPTGLTSTSTINSATVSWTAVSGATNYTVEYKANTANDWISWVAATTTIKQTITGLASGTLYDWRVRNNCPAGGSIFVNSQFATFIPCVESYEPNNSLSAALNIPIDADVKSQIVTGRDKDYFVFSNTTAQRNIIVNLTTLPANYELALYSPAGKSVATSKKTGTTSEQIIYNTTVVGAYKVYVYPNSTSNYNNTTCYTLRVSLGASAFGARTGRGGDQDTTVDDLKKTTGYWAENEQADKKIGLSVYPLPASNFINISFVATVGVKAEITLFNMLGVTQISKTLDTNEGANYFKLDVNKLQNGIYFIKVNNGENTEVKKVVIMH